MAKRRKKVEEAPCQSQRSVSVEADIPPRVQAYLESMKKGQPFYDMAADCYEDPERYAHIKCSTKQTQQMAKKLAEVFTMPDLNQYRQQAKNTPLKNGCGWEELMRLSGMKPQTLEEADFEANGSVFDEMQRL